MKILITGGLGFIGSHILKDVKPQVKNHPHIYQGVQLKYVKDKCLEEKRKNND